MDLCEKNTQKMKSIKDWLHLEENWKAVSLKIDRANLTRDLTSPIHKYPALGSNWRNSELRAITQDHTNKEITTLDSQEAHGRKKIDESNESICESDKVDNHVKRVKTIEDKQEKKLGDFNWTEIERIHIWYRLISNNNPQDKRMLKQIELQKILNQGENKCVKLFHGEKPGGVEYQDNK